MSENVVVNATEKQSRDLAESSRDDWGGRSFLREIFLGRLHLDWIAPWQETAPRPAFLTFMKRFEAFLESLDSPALEDLGAYPDDVLDTLRELGAFGIKIDPKYGGLGFDQLEYCRVCELAAAYDGNVAALISAHNSIGVPQPVKLFGTEDQKQRFLTRCAKGAISAFALTEPDVGSDPARLATMARRIDDDTYSITGSKLWITNGTIAELMVVMAREEDSGKISAFVVDMASEGVGIGHHCRFMGLKALANGVITFNDVRVSVKDRIGEAGQGLKIALITLNTGRLSLPSACVGASRRCVEWAREFAAERVQWGAPVGHHEAISHKLADLAATTFAMESWSRLAADLSMREGYDIRLEAACAKEWASTRGWEVIDEALQIRGGRGYETERSLAARGEAPHPIERMMRDSRINRIFEGSSEIMHLFMAREMVDTHLKISGKMLEKDSTLGERMGALPGMIAFYGRWYPGLWWGAPTAFKYGDYGRLGEHLRYAERASRRLARNVFHGMVRYQAGLEKKQAWLFRTVDIAMEIAVLAATCVRAHERVTSNHPQAGRALDLADLHGQNARVVIERRFRDLWENHDEQKRLVGRAVCDGQHAWMETPANPEPPVQAPKVAPIEQDEPAAPGVPEPLAHAEEVHDALQEVVTPTDAEQIVTPDDVEQVVTPDDIEQVATPDDVVETVDALVEPSTEDTPLPSAHENRDLGDPDDVISPVPEPIDVPDEGQTEDREEDEPSDSGDNPSPKKRKR